MSANGRCSTPGDGEYGEGEGAMFGPAGKFAREAAEPWGQTADEALGYEEITKFEPQELMEFFDFCAEKMRGEIDSRNRAAGGRRMP